MDGPWLIKYYQERHDPEKTWVALVQFLATSPRSQGFSLPLHLAGDTSLGTKQLHFGGRGKAMLLEVTWSEVRQMAKRDARPGMSACFMFFSLRCKHPKSLKYLGLDVFEAKLTWIIIGIQYHYTDIPDLVGFNLSWEHHSHQ